MSYSYYNTVDNALTTGTIIAIAVGSAIGLVVFIATIVIIICIIKRINRTKNITRQGMILQPAQPYPYPQPWPNQNQPNTFAVANYPPISQTTAPPYF